MGSRQLKRLGSIAFYILVLGLTVFYVFRGEDLGQMYRYLQLADPVMLLPAVAAVLAFILGESFILFNLLRFLGQKPDPRRCCIYSFVGFFYSAITPSASGGQPMQLLHMRRDGISSPVACVVLAIVTVTYKLVLVLLGAAVLLFRPAAVMQYLDGSEAILYLGLLLNVICVGILLAMVFYPAWIRTLARLGIRLLSIFPSFRDSANLSARVEDTLDRYHGAARVLREHPLSFLQVLLVTIVQRFCLFSVVWFTAMAFHYRNVGGLTLTVLYGMISVAVDMLPLPGGMGISEALFDSIFTPIFLDGTLSVMVVCRGISYYTQLLISACMTAVASLFGRRK